MFTKTLTEVAEVFESSRKAFVAVTGQAPVGIALLQERRFTYVNPQVTHLVGYSTDEMIGGMEVDNILCRQERSRVRARLEQCENRRRAEVKLRAGAVRKDGERFMLELRGRPVFYNGDPAVLCYLFDRSRQYDFTQQLVEVQEAEQRRLGEELHDGVASQLTGISMILESYIRDVKQGKGITAQDLQQLQGKVKDGIGQVRRLSHGLNPTKLSGAHFPDVLRELVGDLEAGFEGECRLKEVGDRFHLPEEHALQLYRIAQEAVVNAVRHSQASDVRLELHWKRDCLILTVEDNGVGFHPEDEAGGIGLTSMRERARRIGAKVTIESAVSEGTTVRSWLPRRGA